MTPSGFMGKAQRAAESAALLLEAEDVDGATNRAYYAMFDAARAALAWANAMTDDKPIKTHTGLISTFSRELVKPALYRPSSAKQ